MEFICEEDPNAIDPYFGLHDDWYTAECEEDEAPVRDIVNELHCQEAQARKSDLQLACRLDELANALRLGTTPSFDDQGTSYSPGQSLSEFLCVLEKRLIEKSQSQEEACQDVGETSYNSRTTPKTAASIIRRAKSPPKRLNFGNVTVRPGTSLRGRFEPPTSPDWKSMLHDSSEIICYPSQRLPMYGLTTGDIWKRRAEERSGVCTCPSPPKTPVRQVQAIPIRCIPSPKFSKEDSLLSTSDLRRVEYCGCTVEDILRKKASKKLRSKRFDVSFEDDPSWRHRKADDSPFWKSKKSRISPSRSKYVSCVEDRLRPECTSSEEWLLKCLPSSSMKIADDSKSKKVASSMTSEEWLPRSKSNSSMCCCDDLPKRVAEWTESQFGRQRDKGINAGISCRTLVVNKPMLKRKPTIRAKKLRVKFPDSNVRSDRKYTCRFRCSSPNC